MNRSHLTVAPRWLGLVLAFVPAALAAQAPVIPTGPGVDSTEVRWLAAHVSAGDATNLFSLLGKLSQPEAVQMLPSLFDLDGGRATRQPVGAQYADSLAHRPPSGVAGVVRSAYLISRLRSDADSVFAADGVYALDFTGSNICQRVRLEHSRRRVPPSISRLISRRPRH